ncbi:MAG: L-2-amino-thiazoline-4-carboxylic acid hydrolase [Anaerolineae bacterium]
MLIQRAQAYYRRYWSHHSSERNRANRRLLRKRVLPGLSIYKALLERNDDQEQVLAEVDALFRAAFFRAMMRGIRLLNHLPSPFFIVKPALKLMTRNEYVAGSQEIVEDSADCFAVNVYRCLTLDTLAGHNAQELTVLFCNTDDWLAEALPAISWERTGTLARGDDCCDFRWSRAN